ncbi:MAG: hypothetical protein E7621_01450 [Ruminococcaceae bacterium]|nr:hypothetical protein [Oscillospiraceae bacterium]
MLKTVRNVVFVISAFFAWGIVGSIELERLTLSQGIGYLAFAFCVCAFLLVAEFSFRAAKVLLTVYVIKRKRASKKSRRQLYCDIRSIRV